MKPKPSHSLARLRAAVGPDELRRMIHEEKLLIKTIGLRHGADYRTVVALRREYGIPPRACGHVVIDPHELRDLWKAGKTNGEMAFILRVTKAGIRSALRRYGLTKKKRPWKKPPRYEEPT